MSGAIFAAALLCASVFVALGWSSIVRLGKDERAVVFRLGRLRSPARGPGVTFVAPILDKVVRVSLRPRRLDLSAVEAFTKDGVLVRADAVAEMRITDPEKAIVQVEDCFVATSETVERTLRDALTKRRVGDVLARPGEAASLVAKRTNDSTAAWGVRVDALQLMAVAREGQ